jgi:hypothetical protein
MALPSKKVTCEARKTRGDNVTMLASFMNLSENCENH